jgi:hypothetical protein
MTINQPSRLHTYRLRLLLDESRGLVTAVASDHRGQYVCEAIWPKMNADFVIIARYSAETAEGLISQLTTCGILDLDWQFNEKDLELIGGFDSDELVARI